MNEIKAAVHKHRISAWIGALKAENILPGDKAGDVCNISATYKATSNVDPKRRYSMNLAEPIVAEYELEFLSEDCQVDRLVQVFSMVGRMG